MFLSAWCSLLMAEGFFYSLAWTSFMEGGIGKLQFLKKKINFFHL